MRAIIFIAVWVCILSCNRDKVYFSESKEIPSHSWENTNAVVLEFDVTDTVALYDFLIDIRHGTQYPFSNLFLFTEMTFPNGKMATDTIECQLADERGEWLGSGGGSIFEASFIFKERKKFPITGKYKFEIRHGMRETSLEGICDAGLRIQKSL